MKILMINKFLYPKGGDAICALATGNLLRKKGHEVTFWGMKHSDNPVYPDQDTFVDYIDYNNPKGILKKLELASKIIYNFEARKKIEMLLQRKKFDIVHLNNFAHQISPSILSVFEKYKLPVVMTIHDYKIVCPVYTMRCNAEPCQLCQTGKYYNCFRHKCSKNSCVKSLLSTIEMYIHHRICNFYNKIDLYISPSIFVKDKIKQMGFNNNTVYLTHFIDVAEYEPQYEVAGNSIIYFGRLSEEKGLFTLLQAVKGLDVNLVLVGDGPLEMQLKQKAKQEGIINVTFKGFMSGQELKDEIKSSIAAVMPSQWYEVFGRTIIESFALGKPVIGARIGAITELVKDDCTGFTFESNNTSDLRSKIISIVENKKQAVQMGREARRFVEDYFHEDQYYDRLINIYEDAVEKRDAAIL